MAELVPAPLADLVSRVFSEYRAQGAIFDLPKRSFWVGDERRDLSVSFHGLRASTPVGPAAGPHSQLAQNIVLAWLAGSRIVELKTVQRNDRLVIPRPCIDARTIGYNVEWSQELRLRESLSEYVNAWVLIALLRAAGLPGGRAAGPEGDTIFDLSVGYDLAGITSEPIGRYIAALRDARAEIDARRGALPRRYRDIEVDPCIVRSITLSTFHGCPADEVERIAEHLLRDLGLHVVVKLNPTLLGLGRVREFLHERMGYGHLVLDEAAFEHDLGFGDAVSMLERLRALAASRGLGFGVKLTNTLVVKNTDSYFSDPSMYLSGTPLYVLATDLAVKLREALGPALPMSFSAGVDQHNVVDAVLMGMTPITMCTDLLRPGGYGRLAKYMAALASRMDAVGATTRDDFVLRGRGHEAEALAWAEARGADRAEAVRFAAATNLVELAAAAAADPRYGHARNAKAPRKIGSELHLFDCISCDKCVPVCPNDANFAYETRPRELALDVLRFEGGAPRLHAGEKVVALARHQLANYADFCNECGNCDVFCPEDGGPFIEKPRFFGLEGDFRADARASAFWLRPGAGDVAELVGRIAGRTYALRLDRRAGVARVTDGVVDVELTASTGALRWARARAHTPDGHELRLGPPREMLALLEGILDPRRPSPVNAPRLRASVDAMTEPAAELGLVSLPKLERDPSAPRDIC